MESPSEVVEVEFEDALAEESGGEPTRPRPGPNQAPPQQAPPLPQNFDQAEPEPEPVETDAENQRAAAQEDMEALVAKVAAKEWHIGPEGDLGRDYLQEELSVIGEIQWFSLLGEFLDKAMTGEGAISLNALLSPPQRRNSEQFQVRDFQDADTFIHALGKLLVFAPEFMEKSICIWLSVPDYEWDLVREYMKMSPSRGGMSHDMFEDILAIFIDQNYTSIDRFFRERYGRLRARYQARAKEASQSRSSKR